MALGDEYAIAQACDDPQIARWTPFPSPYTVEHARRWIGRQPRMDAVDLLVVDAADGRLLGWTGLHDVDRDQRRAELGIWMSTAGRRGGNARRAIRLLTRWGFAELGLVRIEALCLVGNNPGRRALESGGFVREGVLRAYEEVKGVRYDTVMLGMVNPTVTGG